MLAVGVQQQHAHLAAVPGVDEPGRVDERDAVTQRQPRARQHQAGVPGRQLDREAGGDRARGRPARSVTSSTRDEVEAGVAVVGPRRQHRGRVQAADAEPHGPAVARGAVRPGASRWPRRRAARPVGARRRRPRSARSARPPGPGRGRGRARRRRCPCARGRRRRRGARPAGRPRRRARAGRRAAASRGRPARRGPASSSRPSPSRAETSTPSGWRSRSSSRRSASSASALLSTSSRGVCSAPISSRTSSTARSISSSSSSGAEASTTCRTRSASRVSSSVAPKASTSWWGSLRMKPTVSVRR